MVKFEEELKRARGEKRPTQNVDEKRAIQKQKEDDEFAATNAMLAAEGKPLIERGGRVSNLRDLRQDPNRESLADADKRGREAATRSGAFGSGAQKKANLEDRKALFEEMKSKGATADLRERARGLGVDDKGWDIAQARLARENRPPTAEEVATFGKEKFAAPASTPVSAPAAVATAPKGEVDFGGRRGEGQDTAMNYLEDFRNAASEVELESITPERMETKKRDLARAAEMADIDKRIAAAAAAVKAAESKRLLDAEKGNKLVGEAVTRRDAAAASYAEKKPMLDAKIAGAQKALANQQSEIASRNPMTTVDKVLVSNPVTLPWLGAKKIAENVGEKLGEMSGGGVKEVNTVKGITPYGAADQKRLSEASQKLESMKAQFAREDERRKRSKEFDVGFNKAERERLRGEMSQTAAR